MFQFEFILKLRLKRLYINKKLNVIKQDKTG